MSPTCVIEKERRENPENNENVEDCEEFCSLCEINQQIKNDTYENIYLSEYIYCKIFTLQYQAS